MDLLVVKIVHNTQEGGLMNKALCLTVLNVLGDKCLGFLNGTCRQVRGKGNPLLFFPSTSCFFHLHYLLKMFYRVVILLFISISHCNEVSMLLVPFSGTILSVLLLSSWVSLYPKLQVLIHVSLCCAIFYQTYIVSVPTN